MAEYKSPYKDTVVLQNSALIKLLEIIKAYPVAGKDTGIRLRLNKDGTHLQIQNTRKVTLKKDENDNYILTVTDENNPDSNLTAILNKYLSFSDGSLSDTGYLNYKEGDTSKKVLISGFKNGNLTANKILIRQTNNYNQTYLENGQLTLYPKSTADKSGINFNISKYTDGQEHYNLRLECKEDGFLDCSGKIRGAVWNDYAEYRESYIKEPGRCIIETGFGDLELSTKRLQLGANIISDTFGFSIGETEKAKTPIAVCGRVLVYPNEDKELYTPGAAVCSGPNGTISLMTREEIKEWPDAIVGYVSEIPYYDTWGTDNIKVNGRIWIKVK